MNSSWVYKLRSNDFNAKYVGKPGEHSTQGLKNISLLLISINEITCLSRIYLYTNKSDFYTQYIAS
jgi:hypothetical protein